MNSDRLQELCGSETNCVINPGVTVGMVGNLDVASLTIKGALLWNDTLQSANTQWICAGYAVVEEAGHFDMNLTGVCSYVFWLIIQVSCSSLAHFFQNFLTIGVLCVYVDKNGIIYIKDIGVEHDKMGVRAFGPFPF